MDTADSSIFDRWIADARTDQLDDCDIAHLAETLANSGARLRRRQKRADLASTGGPGSISTLWSPAAIVACGFNVAKLGVPGRPAGGVDVLMQVDGYRTDLDANEAEGAIERCGYVNLLAGERFAPADAAMFAYRQRMGAQHIPALAIASLLAKKLATGTTLAGLEVRVASHGNFGHNREEARQNARRFCRVAKLLDVAGVCFLSDGMAPQQPYLGRGEALAALSNLLHETGCEWLSQHARQCREWASELVGTGCPKNAEVYKAFIDNIAAQGGTIEILHERARSVMAGHLRVVPALNDGVVGYDLGKLRRAILAARQPDVGQKFDDSAGLILLARPGSHVSAGDPIVSARCNDDVWETFKRSIANSIRFDQAGGYDIAVNGFERPEVISV